MSEKALAKWYNMQINWGTATILRAVRMRVGVGPRGGACASGGGTARIRWRCRAELARWGGAVEVWGGESAAGGW